MATYTSNYGWTKPSGSDNVDISVLNDNLDDQDSTIHDAFLNMAPPFSESSTYAVDDIVLYGTGLYKCHTAVVTPGSWTGSTNWQVYKLSEGGSGGGGGTSDYNPLTNKPQINGVTLLGNKTTNDLGITASGVGAIPSTDKGANGGVAELDSNGKVPSSQLPSYVDDVLSYASQSAFPATGETGKIYIAEDTNKTYRWSGSAYAEISASLALGETSSTAYRGDRGKTAYDHSQTVGNPHGTTKSDVGLSNVPNVSTNDQEPTFTEASTRNNIASGDKLSVIMGKIQKFFNDLKTVAFSGSYNDLTDKPSLATVATSGSYNDLTDKLTFDNVPTDGSNNPVKSDGIYDSEKDIYAVMGKMGAKNLISYPYKDITKTVSGITFTDNGDGSVTVSTVSTGATETKTFDISTRFQGETNDIILKNGTYILSGCPIGGSSSSYKLSAAISKNGVSTNIGNDVGEGVTINAKGDDYSETTTNIGIGITISSGTIITTPITFKPMLRLASDTDDTYQPYAKTNRELTDELKSEIDKFWSLGSGMSIANNTDLNDITTIGNYYATTPAAATLAHCPIAGAFKLKVLYDVRESAPTYIEQVFNPMLSYDEYRRYKAGSAEWSDWHLTNCNLDNIITKIPDAPTTDGTYNLSVTVVDGTPTYSWVSTS